MPTRAILSGHSDRDKGLRIADEVRRSHPLLLSGLGGQCFDYGDVLQQILRQTVPLL